MLAFAVLCFSLLFSAVLGVPLAQRDVFNPTITNPHDGTVWMVGTKEQVTWETDNIPPDSQLTNPTGQVILGFLENNSLNLQLENPLAKGFNIRDGKVTITVPDVPPRNDYIIVLMGDSGNASPAFAITSISGGSSSSSRPSSTESSPTSSAIPPATSTPSTASSTVVSNSPPITGSVITGGISTTSESSLAPEATSTAPGLSNSVLASLTSSVSSASTSLSQTASAAAASVTSNAAGSNHNIKLWSVIAAPLALCLFI
ncbi:hypothetical protein P691DRAFT_801954 [Macrolepiota fuliginosa MF-IS2]|uniref:Yeast cell wall synthesis Kre9/Knh1-like N-terminal domain-containing protein n=1 Tax=Macrolepiota fuliginosa MF-IS2 TaxID=1400762 RepID=A0A9P6C624_9AGAR|nr:hypothetical protein P691DRAFT_801954 [Macrolepiota fuliginosa MF-IS2]